MDSFDNILESKLNKLIAQSFKENNKRETKTSFYYNQPGTNSEYKTTKNSQHKTSKYLEKKNNENSDGYDSYAGGDTELQLMSGFSSTVYDKMSNLEISKKNNNKGLEKTVYPSAPKVSNLTLKESNTQYEAKISLTPINQKKNLNSDLSKKNSNTNSEKTKVTYSSSHKRAEYCIIWRDPNYGNNTAFGKYVEKLKKFIDDEVNYKLYIAAKVEDALNLVRKKKHNKIILISNIGIRYGGRYFVKEARKIIGFNAVVLFQSYDEAHLQEDWLINFPNALFSNKEQFLKEYILNFNEEGLKSLKKKIEDYYDCKFKDFEEPFKYPYFFD